MTRPLTRCVANKTEVQAIGFAGVPPVGVRELNMDGRYACIFDAISDW